MNRDLLAGTVEALESDDAFYESVEGIVAAEADVFTSVELGATLADQDLSGLDHLAAEALHAQHFWITIATVFRTTTGFFMCHDSTPELSEISREKLTRSLCPAGSIWKRLDDPKGLKMIRTIQRMAQIIENYNSRLTLPFS